MTANETPETVGRLAELLADVFNLVDAAPIASFLDDRVYDAAQRLSEALEVMLSAATAERVPRDGEAN